MCVREEYSFIYCNFVGKTKNPKTTKYGNYQSV